MAAATPMVTAGTASAQADARLRGRYWVSEDRGDEKGKGEVVTRLYEVTRVTPRSAAREHRR